MHDGSVILVDIRSHTEWFAVWSGRYDDALISLLLKLLDAFPGEFLDVGGNIGMYAVRVSRASARKTICFEPMPENAERIRQNALLNGIGGELEVIEAALSDKKGAVDLILREDFEAGASTGNASIAISKEADGDFEKISVPVMMFDEFLKCHGGTTIPIAKVDIEGHEDFFLRGAQHWLARDRPVVLVEVNNWFYHQRGTTTSTAFKSSLPADYRAGHLKTRLGALSLEEIPFDQLSALDGLHNCLLYPPEKQETILALFV